MTVDVCQNKNNLKNMFRFLGRALNWHSDSSLRDSINLQRRYFKHSCQPLNREGGPTILQLTIPPAFVWLRHQRMAKKKTDMKIYTIKTGIPACNYP